MRVAQAVIRFFGGAVFVVCALAWGREKAKALYKRQKLTAALADFAAFCGERISAFRDPLDVIFASFENNVLGASGFIGILRSKGCRAAASDAAATLSAEDAALLLEFAKKIGGENGDAQAALCTYTASRLENSASRQLGELADKARLYRLLPTLAALSAVILLI